jgi:hypothetical protein
LYSSDPPYWIPRKDKKHNFELFTFSLRQLEILWDPLKEQNTNGSSLWRVNEKSDEGQQTKAFQFPSCNRQRMLLYIPSSSHFRKNLQKGRKIRFLELQWGFLFMVGCFVVLTGKHLSLEDEFSHTTSFSCF